MTLIAKINKIKQPENTKSTKQKLAGTTNYYEAVYDNEPSVKYACIQTFDSSNKDVAQVISFNYESAIAIITLLKATFKI